MRIRKVDGVMNHLKPVQKSTEGLRDALFDELNSLRQGKSTPQKARAMSLLARDIIDSIRVQIQYARLLNDKKEKPILLGVKNEK